MLYRRFGRTELPMPVLSCGGMRYQYKWQDVSWSEIPDDNQRNLEATIQRAWELGITHIETARGYGSSEMQLGKILPTLPRDPLIVQTKVSPKEDAQEFRDTFFQSLEYLRLDYVDLLGLHGINTAELMDYSLRPGGCLDVAYELKAAGYVRHIGFSTHAPLPVILAGIRSQRFDYINLHWYYINQQNWPAILAAQAQDMGVFIISPANKGGMLYRPSQKLIDLCQPLSPLVFNDLFCLSHPQVHTLSVGAAQPTDFEEHLQALAVLDQAGTLLPPIIDRLQVALETTLGADYAQRWSEGLPPPEETPGQVNIPMILWLRNLVLAYDMVEYGKMRYNLLGNGGHWFPGRKAELVDPQQLAPVLQKSPFADLIPAYLQEADRLLQGEAVTRLSNA
ncbi:MAG: aldo/keto reductase [Synechococcales cyanobacterium]